MIKLTRLNNQSLIVNSDLIKLIEAAPDTVLTLVNGEKIIVRESSEQVLERIVEFRRRLLRDSPAKSPEPAVRNGESVEGAGKPDSSSGSGS